MRAIPALCVAAAALIPGAIGIDAVQTEAPPITWRLDNLTRIGSHQVTVLGDPRVVSTDIGDAMAFDGVDDGLFLDANPLHGLSRFTAEILFQPAPGGPEEQRFLHFEEPAAGNRALIELRMRPDSQWALDTFLRSNEKGLTLLDRERLHPAGRWHVASLTYDGRTMRHFVDGQPELSGETAFAAMGAGRTSVGVRQTKVSWFKGLLHSVRITPDALPPARMMTVPVRESGRTVVPLWPEGVPGANSLLLYQAARRAGVGAELHLYERGPHGFGTRTDVGPAGWWVGRWFDWLRAHDFVPSATGITACPHAACGGR